MILGSKPVGPEGGHLAGRALLKELYEAHFGTDLPEIRTTPRGKPYFEGSNVYFSISHSKSRVFCVLSDRPVGIDAEETDRQADLRLAKKVLSAGEYSQFERADDPRKVLLTFWVLKEAHAKCTGEGLRGYPNHTEFVLPDPRVWEQEGHLVALIEGEK